MFKYDDIKFRAIDESDLDFLLDIRSDEEVNEHLFTVFPISKFTQKDWLKNLLSNNTYKIFMVINEENERVGYLRLNDIDFLNRRVEIGADIVKNYRGKGYGKKIYQGLIKYCFDYLNMRKIYLYVFEENEKAISVYKKSGFEIEGILKEHIFRKGWKNIVMMSLFNTVEEKK